MRTVSVEALTEIYKPGSGCWSWDEEMSDLLDWDREKMIELKRDILKHGILEPVTLGNEGRIWDGHHRICIARELGIKVPIKFSGEDDD